MAHFGNDAIALINKKPGFDLSELNSEGKRLFQDTTLFVNAFAEYLPEAGTCAWDICEKIGFYRHAYTAICRISFGKSDLYQAFLSLPVSAV